VIKDFYSRVFLDCSFFLDNDQLIVHYSAYTLQIN